MASLSTIARHASEVAGTAIAGAATGAIFALNTLDPSAEDTIATRVGDVYAALAMLTVGSGLGAVGGVATYQLVKPLATAINRQGLRQALWDSPRHMLIGACRAALVGAAVGAAALAVVNVTVGDTFSEPLFSP